jgi:hypothetical protein
MEKLACEIEDVIFKEGCSIKGGELRRILREELDDEPRAKESKSEPSEHGSAKERASEPSDEGPESSPSPSE